MRRSLKAKEKSGEDEGIWVSPKEEGAPAGLGKAGIEDMEESRERKKKVSFVIPCYRSEQTISGVAAEIREKMRAMGRYEYEIVLVNDCSPDRTFEVIRKLCREQGLMAVVSIHDLNLAAAYCQQFLMLRQAKVFAQGGEEILTPENLRAVYGVEAEIAKVRGRRIIVPFAE